MKITKTLATVALSIATVATLATAPGVGHLRPGDGSGFVGKGDVQLALGLNNKQMQEAASSLESPTTTRRPTRSPAPASSASVTKTFDRVQNLNGEVAYDARTRKQVTGFDLTGWDGEPTLAGAPLCFVRPVHIDTPCFHVGT